MENYVDIVKRNFKYDYSVIIIEFGYSKASSKKLEALAAYVAVVQV